MNYAELREYDVTNGPGVRVSLFVSGCHLGCKGCFNEKAQSFSYGKRFTQSTLNKILKMADLDRISGLSLLGGDPFAPENTEQVYEICKSFKEQNPKKTIYCWTGYLIDDLVKRTDNYTLKILELIDTLIDGPFVLEKKDLRLRLRGSSNQRILHKKDIALWLKHKE